MTDQIRRANQRWWAITNWAFSERARGPKDQEVQEVLAFHNASTNSTGQQEPALSAEGEPKVKTHSKNSALRFGEDVTGGQTLI